MAGNNRFLASPVCMGRFRPVTDIAPRGIKGEACRAIVERGNAHRAGDIEKEAHCSKVIRISPDKVPSKQTSVRHPAVWQSRGLSPFYPRSATGRNDHQYSMQRQAPRSSAGTIRVTGIISFCLSVLQP